LAGAVPSSRSLAALLGAALLVTLTAPADARTARARAPAAAPMILLLHGGGWQTGDPASMNPWRDDFAARGYRTRIVAYPLGNVTRSIDYTDAIAQQERLAGAPVIAYGISAGGTIAAALAAGGRVDGGVNVIGPTDFTRWLSPVGTYDMLAAHMTAAEKRSASPYWRLHGLQTPQLIQCGLADPVTTYDQCTRYASAARGANADTTLQSMIDAHAQSAAERDHARAWVQARWPATG
jgi:acetyl esterase/lipase